MTSSPVTHQDPRPLLERADVRHELAESPQDPALSQQDHQMLAVLLDPRNDPNENSRTAEDCLELFAGYTGMDHADDRLIAERLRMHYHRAFGRYVFDFDHLEDTGYYQVTLFPKKATGIALVMFDDMNYPDVDRHGFIGLRGAIYAASSINSTFTRLCVEATRIVKPGVL